MLNLRAYGSFHYKVQRSGKQLIVNSMPIWSNCQFMKIELPNLMERTVFLPMLITMRTPLRQN